MGTQPLRYVSSLTANVSEGREVQRSEQRTTPQLGTLNWKRLNLEESGTGSKYMRFFEIILTFISYTCVVPTLKFYGVQIFDE